MTTIFEKTFERTLDRVVGEASAYPEGTSLELWVFEDEAARRAAERRLAERGIRAKIRSAYKPLLHAFLEEIDRGGLETVKIAYPVHPAAPANRFLLETYPLAEMLGTAKLVLEPSEGEGCRYEAELGYRGGRSEKLRIFAPNRVWVDHVGETVLASTGWITLRSPGLPPRDERLGTDYEELFEAMLGAVSSHPWGTGEPFFKTLRVRAEIPAEDNPLPIGHEAISLREALHEDCYFSLLELFQKKTGRPLNDRTIRPGQIIPEIVGGDRPALRVEIGESPTEDRAVPVQELSRAQAPIPASQVSDILSGIPGISISGRSSLGRTVPALYHPGADAAVMISGGQHANETTGVVGALRAVLILSGRPGAHFAVSPLENPDGYDLHRRLCADNPRHMHHAARYTAQGNDLEFQAEPLQEKAVRKEARVRSGAQLHINLHGYPSHEWNRPLTGYIPRGFSGWMLPHGFFLVLRHHRDWTERAARFLDRLTKKLSDLEWLVEFNRIQLSAYNRYVDMPPFTMINGFPCDLVAHEGDPIPLRLITEYPDETIWGEDFAQGHNAQTETVLAAYDAFQALSMENE